MCLLGWFTSLAEVGSSSSSLMLTNGATSGSIPDLTTNNGQRAEQIRTTCIENRRFIAGRIVQVTAEGLVVDSGYRKLLSPPFNHSWVVRGTALVDREPNLVEEKTADALCVGLVFLSNIPKRPAVKSYDYVVIHGYPAGEYSYVPVPGVQKTIRRFSASLERAVQINLEREGKQSLKTQVGADR
jgi:hypothetical protein